MKPNHDAAPAGLRQCQVRPNDRVRRFRALWAAALGSTALVGLGIVSSPASAAGPTTQFTVSGDVTAPQTFTLQSLRALPSTTENVSFLATNVPTTQTFTGVSLWTLLNSTVGIVTNPAVKNDILREVVLSTGSDGYQAVIAMGEINPNFGGKAAAPDLVAYASNGQPLTTDGFARTVIPGDLRGGRYVSNLTDIQVIHAPTQTRTFNGGLSSSFTVTGNVTAPASFTLGGLRAMPATSVTVGGATYTGVSLWTLLNNVGVVTNPTVKNNILTDYVVATGSDGYQAVVSLGEINPTFGNNPDLVAYAVNGGSLGADGFARLVVPNDLRQGRWVSNLVNLEVFDTTQWVANANEIADLTGLNINAVSFRLNGGTLASTNGVGVLTVPSAQLNGGIIDTGVTVQSPNTVVQASGTSVIRGALNAPTLAVNGGILELMGGRVSGAATVASGAKLGGFGTVGSFVALRGATVAPGLATPYATLNVTGAATFQPGSTYAVAVNATGQTDRIAAAGAAALQGGTVSATFAPGSYSATQRFTILTAAGGVTGTFAGLTLNGSPPGFTFLTPSLAYDPNDVTISFLRNGTSFASVATTANQRATGAALDAAGAGKAFAAVVSAAASAAAQAFDLLSGEIHASAVSNAFEDARLPRQGILDRLAEPYGTSTPDVSPTAFTALYTKSGPVLAPRERPSVYTAWGQGFGDFGRIGGNGNAAALDRSMGGFVAGIDVSPDTRWRAGVAGGTTQSFVTSRARGASGELESVFGGVYAGGSFNRVQLRGGGLIGASGYDLSRSVAFPGFADTTRSRSGGTTAQLFGEAGYRLGFGRFGFEPIVGGLAMHIETDSFRESGGAAALTGFGRSYDYQAVTAGARFDTAGPLFAGLPVTAHGALAYQHVFGPVSPTALLAFTNAPANTFTVAGAPIARDALVAEAGIDYRLTANATAGLLYAGSVGSRTYDNAVKGRVEVRF